MRQSWAPSPEEEIRAEYNAQMLFYSGLIVVLGLGATALGMVLIRMLHG